MKKFSEITQQPNEYSKGYQMYRKIPIPDRLNRFKDPAEAKVRLNIRWNELSETEVSHMFAFTLIYQNGLL